MRGLSAAAQPRYDMNAHGQHDGRQTPALTDEFVDGYAIVGVPASVRRGLANFGELRVTKFGVIGPDFVARTPEVLVATARSSKTYCPSCGDIVVSFFAPAKLPPGHACTASPSGSAPTTRSALLVCDPTLRFEADERPSLLLSLGVAGQYVSIAVTSVVLTPVVLVTLGGGSEDYLAWAVFAAVVVSGVATIVQSARFGRIGGGYILVMGSTPAYLPVCVTALEVGGPALMATLIVMSSFVQFVLGWKMAALRRIFTPTVAGTVLLLIVRVRAARLLVIR